MKPATRIIYYLIIFTGILITAVSLLSLLHDLSSWYSKILDFPRLQYLIIAAACLLLFLFLNKRWKFPSVLLALGLLGAIAIQSTRIFPYWFGEKNVPEARATADADNSVGILIANVLITNRQASDFLEIVKTRNPDMLLVMETDSWWVQQLQPLKEHYAYTMELPLDNAYGMALYSKFPLQDRKVKYLQHEDVPSFHARVELPSGRFFRFHGVHPVPPFPSSKYPDNVGLQEVALIKTGKIVAADSLPSVVAGDFNDVSWSHTSRLFKDYGNLRNARLGRGLYNTYNAKSPLLRWPLDHYFVTPDFAVAELERLPEFNSDHFPMFARFVLF